MTIVDVVDIITGRVVNWSISVFIAIFQIRLISAEGDIFSKGFVFGIIIDFMFATYLLVENAFVSRGSTGKFGLIHTFSITRLGSVSLYCVVTYYFIVDRTLVTLRARRDTAAISLVMILRECEISLPTNTVIAIRSLDVSTKIGSVCYFASLTGHVSVNISDTLMLRRNTTKLGLSVFVSKGVVAAVTFSTAPDGFLATLEYPSFNTFSVANSSLFRHECGVLMTDCYLSILVTLSARGNTAVLFVSVIKCQIVRPTLT